MTTVDHLALAKEDLAIAESTDAKREAYKRAAEHLAAYREESPKKWRQEAASYCNTKVSTIDKLIRWRKAGYPEGTTPFTMADPNGSKPTERAAASHAKAVLQDPEQRATVIESLPESVRLEIAQAAIAPEIREGERREKEMRAHRDRTVKDRTHVELIGVEMERIRIATLAARNDASGTTWTEEGSAAVNGMIDARIAHLEELREDVKPTTGVDWDEAAAALLEDPS